jgi:deoxyribodipyrimidine photo-lyase
VIKKRVRKLNELAVGREGPVVYWMSRDQRVGYNWALLVAQELAETYLQPHCVVFCLVPEFLGATIRQYRFMIDGLKEVENELNERNIPFCLLTGRPEEEIPRFVEEIRASVLVSDFDPLRIKRKWKDEVLEKTKVPFYEVDAHNIVPCWVASPKQEFAAHTIRGKIRKLLPQFLTGFPRLKTQTEAVKLPDNDWKRAEKSLKVDFTVRELEWIQPGEKQAQKMLENFIKNKLSRYPDNRNDPTKEAVSDLSPYLHFGQLSAQRVALEVRKSGIKGREDFLEELIIRRELSDNFCFYNPHYDRFDGFPDWARKTLDEHRKDPREYLYALEQFESGQTHDDLWNAAQMEMVKRGKMHGYMRMYWAKKILEWTKSPEEAQKIAIFLNDKYELDGRDPNGYVGIAWSIGGVHDRAWGQRPVFGKIRYMSYNGCKSKFNVAKYIEDVNRLMASGE